MNGFKNQLDNSAVLQVEHAVGVTLKVWIVGDLLVSDIISI
jgi:hypothetical protein